MRLPAIDLAATTSLLAGRVVLAAREHLAGEARFWRIDGNADYGALNGLARIRINTATIEDNWDDLLRVVGSLKLGAVTASEFVRPSSYRSGPRPWRARWPTWAVWRKACSCSPT